MSLYCCTPSLNIDILTIKKLCEGSYHQLSHSVRSAVFSQFFIGILYRLRDIILPLSFTMYMHVCACICMYVCVVEFYMFFFNLYVVSFN